jgi:flagella basal body P-ring formation protein FlgA
MKNFWLISLLFLHCPAANAVEQHDHAALKTAVSSFVQQQTAALPGKVAYHIDEIDSRLALRPCNKVEVFLPSGSQLIGRVSIGVRCLDANGWSIFIPVQIKISRDLLISTRPLTLGQIIHEEDISRQTTEMTQNSGITDAKQVIGKVLRYSIAAGYILRVDMLRAPYSVKQGQVVQLSVQGSGFSMSSSGVALSNASEGESVQIRTSTGRVVSGIAIEEGVVKINP